MQKQKVFIPVDTSNYNEGYKTQFELCDNIKSIGWYNGEKREHLGATHWLKEQEGYFFTAEELKILESNLDSIDETLSYFEDWMHGEDGKEVTAARKVILEIKNFKKE